MPRTVDTPDTTARWVAEARRGDRDARDRLFRRFAPAVHGVLLGLLQPADADDATQGVFETAFARLDTLRDDAAFPGWLLSIARRAGSDAFRRRPRDCAGDADVNELPMGAVQEAVADAQRVMAAIRALPEAYREPLVLRLVEGLTGPEIADITGLTPGSVRVNLHRGMALLRAALGIDTAGGAT